MRNSRFFSGDCGNRAAIALLPTMKTLIAMDAVI
jgi:hypothetical protein